MSTTATRCATVLIALIIGAQPALSEEPLALASFPGPTFLENLAIGPQGALLVTNYSARRIERVMPEGGSQTLAELEIHPVSLVAEPDGFAVVAHGVSFTQGEAFVGTGRFLRLDAAGTVLSDRPLGGVLFANGVLAVPGGYLIADSIGARVVRLDAASGTIATFFGDARLAPQTEPFFLPGVNGLKREGDALVLSSSANRALYRLPLDEAGEPAGDLEEIVADLPGADDFAVLPEGGFVVATHGESVVAVDPQGGVTTVSDDARLRGSTAVSLIGEGAERRAIVLGTGGFSEGLGAEAVVLAVPLPPR